MRAYPFGGGVEDEQDENQSFKSESFGESHGI